MRALPKPQTVRSISACFRFKDQQNSASPEVVSQAWEGREGPIKLAGVEAEGYPIANYITCASKYLGVTLDSAD